MLRRIEAPQVVVSRDEFDFVQSVRDFARNEEAHLLIFGGDGTIHRALNEVVPIRMKHIDTPAKSIGFFRGGSGNGYHDSYGIPRTLRKQLRTFAESMRCGCLLPVDVMEIRYDSLIRYGQLFGTGFDADVLKRRNAWLVDIGTRRKPMPGLLNYVRAALITFRRLEISRTKNRGEQPCEGEESGDIRLDVRREKPASEQSLQSHAPMIEIGKRPYYGNRFKVCPGADPSSGPMELILFDFKTKRSVLLHLFPLWMGWHGLINRVRGNGKEFPISHYRADSCEIRAERSLDFHVDGELITRLPGPAEDHTIRIRMRKSAVTFLVPKEYIRQNDVAARPPPPSHHP
jgi:diacylglycerol kinase family enzyme